MNTLKRLIATSTALAWLFAAPVAAEDWRTGYSLYGMPGLIDMPSALAPPDAQVSTTIGGFDNQQRTTFSFQITPRLTGAFRYSRFDEFTGPGTDDTFDRSFDIQYQLWDEGEVRPAVAIGLRDFLGTGLYTSEYIVATKTLSPQVRVTGGIGWGRLGTEGGFSNPLGVFAEEFETRPALDVGSGGTPAYDQFFRGDAALFAGAEWRVRDDVTLIAEYSSDAYVAETDKGVVDVKSPLNFGVRYSPRPGYDLGLYYLYGSEIGASATIYFNPQDRPAPSGFDGAPLPVAVRAQDARQAQSWDRAAQPPEALGSVIVQALALDGFEVSEVELGDRFARVRYRNTSYRAEAQGIGRVSRALTQILPPSIETFVLEPMQRGIPLSAVTIRRSDLEVLENAPDNAWRMLARAGIDEVGDPSRADDALQIEQPFQWGISPYLELSLFDGDEPVRGDAGLEASFRYTVQPNLVLNGAIRQRLAGNRADGVISPSDLQPVRRNGALYGADGGVVLENLYLTHYGRPGQNLYSRVSAGYLERMFGGVSGEVLWKPVDSRLALGAELNYVVQRDYDMGFGAQDFADIGTYDVVTGHASAYYDFQNGFHGQVDVGRYLAGDWGATFTLTREFENGWELGAYATFTDVPFEEFGEGSFDKGIIVTIPTDWVLGQPTRSDTSANIASLSRDGGARLSVDGRLYDVVRDGHEPVLSESWGRFWR